MGALPVKYTPRPLVIEAVFLDTVETGLNFLQYGEFTAILRSGFHVHTPLGIMHAPLEECYLIRWDHGIDIMDKTEFEKMYQEAQ